MTMTDPQTPQNVQLHCAQCDTQLGVFENEWIHLTSSYARPKEKGINTGCRIGTRTQIVPNGSAQKEAVGCMMVELFCDKCSSVVGQSCKTASDPDQEYLLNLRFFKLSRIYLKDTNHDRRAEPVFVDPDSFDRNSRSGSVRSSVVPKTRAPSRNGATPSFRQSYPPPSSYMQTYDQYQPHHTPMLPPSQFPVQTPPPTFIHYQPPTNAYSHPQYALNPSRPQYDIQDPFRPTSMLADDLQNLHQKTNGLTTSISDCLDRIVAVEARLTSGEQKLTDGEKRSLEVTAKLQYSEAPVAEVRQRLEDLEKICHSQTSIHAQTHAQTHDTIVEQKAIVARQAEQLASITEKLDTLKNNMIELNTQIEDLRSRPIPQPSPQSKKLDFLDNMEVMVKAMRSIQSTQLEPGGPREKNHASLPDQDLHESHLGKRKRPIVVNDAQQRKLPRRDSDTSTHDDRALPTPDSTQNETHSLDVSQTSFIHSRVHVTADEQSDYQVSQVQPHKQERSTVPVVEDQQSISRGDPVLLGNQGGKPVEEVVQDVVEKHSAPSDTHRARAVTGSSSIAPPSYNSQLAYVPHRSTGVRDFHMEPPNTPHHFMPWTMSGSQHSTPYRPNFGYGRTTSANTIHNPSNAFPPVNTSMLPSSQIFGPLPGSVDPRLAKWKRDNSVEPQTFSDALSRGHRLEDVIQRAPRRSSVIPSDSTQQRNTQFSTETGGNALNRQPSVTTSQQGLVPHAEIVTRQDQTQVDVIGSVEVTKNAEVIDFSDEENTVRVVVDSGDAQKKHITSTTPNGEPNTPRIGRVSVARTIRELTQEPLRRPIIMDQEQERRPSAAKAVIKPHQRPVLPGFAAAIHNLNGSAARHVATSSPQPSDKEVSRRSQGSVPVTQVPAVTNAEQIDLANKEALPIAPEAEGRGRPIAITAETQEPRGESSSIRPARGRPRKAQTAHETNSSTAISGNDNHHNECAMCKKRGKLLCCDGCPKTYHHRCLNPPMDPRHDVEGDWFCPSCTTQRERQSIPPPNTFKPRRDESVMNLRRKLAEEAVVRDMAKTKSG